MRIIWACTGSVATVKVPRGVQLLRDAGHEVRIIVTQRGHTMLCEGPAERYQPAEVWDAFVNANNKTDADEPVLLRDEDEWASDYAVGRDPVLHIELRKWAQLMIIAPLSANTLAKLANGMCDNLLTCVVRCWDFSKQPIYLCPAMNTLMWDNPFTRKHLAVLTELPNVHVINPISKQLACKDTGVGAMEEVERIVERVLRDIR